MNRTSQFLGAAFLPKGLGLAAVILSFLLARTIASPPINKATITPLDFDDLDASERADIIRLLEEAKKDGDEPLDVVRAGLEVMRRNRKLQQPDKPLENLTEARKDGQSEEFPLNEINPLQRSSGPRAGRDVKALDIGAGAIKSDSTAPSITPIADITNQKQSQDNTSEQPKSSEQNQAKDQTERSADQPLMEKASPDSSVKFQLQAGDVSKDSVSSKIDVNKPDFMRNLMSFGKSNLMNISPLKDSARASDPLASSGAETTVSKERESTTISPDHVHSEGISGEPEHFRDVNGHDEHEPEVHPSPKPSTVIPQALMKNTIAPVEVPHIDEDSLIKSRANQRTDPHPEEEHHEAQPETPRVGDSQTFPENHEEHIGDRAEKPHELLREEPHEGWMGAEPEHEEGEAGKHSDELETAEFDYDELPSDEDHLNQGHESLNPSGQPSPVIEKISSWEAQSPEVKQDTTQPIVENIDESYIDRSNPSHPQKVHYKRKSKSHIRPDGYSHNQEETRTTVSLNPNAGAYRHRHHSSSSYSSTASSSTYHNGGGNNRYQRPNSWNPQIRRPYRVEQQRYTPVHNKFPRIPHIPAIPSLPPMQGFNYMPTYGIPVAGTTVGMPAGFYGHSSYVTPSAGYYVGAYADPGIYAVPNVNNAYRQSIRNAKRKARRAAKRQMKKALDKQEREALEEEKRVDV